DLKHVERIAAQPAAPGLTQLPPIAQHVPVAANGSDVGEHAGDVESRVLGVHLKHRLELVAVPALEAFLDLEPVEHLGCNRPDDRLSIRLPLQCLVLCTARTSCASPSGVSCSSWKITRGRPARSSTYTGAERPKAPRRALGGIT